MIIFIDQETNFEFSDVVELCESRHRVEKRFRDDFEQP